MKPKLLIFFFFFLIVSVKAQKQDSKSIISAYWDSVWYEFVTGKTILTLNQNTGDLHVNIDLNPIHSDIDTLEKLLHKDVENVIVFKGNIAMPVSLLYQEANKGKSYNIICNIEVNKITKPLEISFSPISKNTTSPEPSTNSNESPLYLTIKMDFDPKKFNLQNYYSKLPSIIKIEIIQGYLNKVY